MEQILKTKLSDKEVIFLNGVAEQGNNIVSLSKKLWCEIPAVITGESNKQNYIIEELIVPPRNKMRIKQDTCIMELGYLNKVNKKIGGAHTHLTHKLRLKENISDRDIIATAIDRSEEKSEIKLTYFLDGSFILYEITPEIRKKAKYMNSEYLNEMHSESGWNHDKWCWERYCKQIEELKKEIEIVFLNEQQN